MTVKKTMGSGADLQILLHSIKSSEVVEVRVQLLKELGEIDLSDKSAVASVIETLIILWEEFTCLDISQCTLNKTILHVASLYFEKDISGCLVQFLGFGIKANIWCQKHLKMTLMSTEDSPEEEHSDFFYQLILDLLSYSAASYSALARYIAPTNNELMASFGSFISEQFTLIKDLVSEIQKLHTVGTELLKGAQASLEAVTRLCRVYCDDVDWDNSYGKINRDCKEAEHRDRVIAVVNCTVEKLCELGVVAANDGGSLVSLLNTSWKGVVSLLQLGKGAFAAKINIPGVIMTLISLASESLRCAAETWSSSSDAKVSIAEAKRIFLPVKFYLINAVRIISQYQSQALSVFREIALCVLMILTFRISLSKLEHLSSVSEVLAEILEPSSLHLLNSLLNSAQVSKENKSQILDFVFFDLSFQTEITSSDDALDALNAIFSVTTDNMCKEKMFSIGRVTLFLNLLKSAADLEDDIRIGIARKLGWLLNEVVDEDVYPSILALKTSSRDQKTISHPVYGHVLHALKTFMIAVSSTPAWKEVESFLIENLFHPHFLCWEIITELWCFIIRHADTDMVNEIIDKLCSLLRLTYTESSSFPVCDARKPARLICTLVTYGPREIVDRVYTSLSDCNTCPPTVLTILIIEGFPLNLLSENNRIIAKQRIVTQYFEFLETFKDNSPGQQSNSGTYGAPVFALSAASQSLQVKLPDTDTRTLKFLVEIINRYKSSPDNPIKDTYRKLLGQLLTIISNTKHFYSLDEIDKVISEVKSVFISGDPQSDSKLFLCKPNLVSFIAGLGHLELGDGDENSRGLAVCELYYMLLRERHWAFIHLGVTAFGYFAERTSCGELWRFVPQDAALSFDLESGNEVNEDRFMSELKAFLDKERVCENKKGSFDQLVKEGLMLKEIIQRNTKVVMENVVCDAMEIDQPNKKRKFPDGICRGVEVLQSGLKIMVDGLSEWKPNQSDSMEDHDKFMTHFSLLEDVIQNMVSLADSG